MHRIYCDSNLYRQINPLHSQYNANLASVFTDLKHKLFFCFSDAHLDDLSGSTNREKTERDLDSIAEWCRDHYISYDHICDKKIQLHIDALPKEIFWERKKSSAEWNILEPLDFDKLFEEIEETPELKTVKDMLSRLLHQPMGLSQIDFGQQKMDERAKAMLNKMIPGMNREMSLGEFSSAWLPYGNRLLYDKKEYSE